MKNCFFITLAALLISNTAYAAYYKPLANSSVSSWEDSLSSSIGPHVITLREDSPVFVDKNTGGNSITSTNGGTHTFVFGSNGISLYSISNAHIHFEGNTSLSITLNDDAVETILSGTQNEGSVFSQVIVQIGASGYDYIQIPGIYYLSTKLSGNVSSPTFGSLEVLPTIVFSENSIQAGQVGIVATKLPYNANSTGERYSQFKLVAKGPVAPATPEPATVTLSLLALAGIATQRRRNSPNLSR